MTTAENITNLRNDLANAYASLEAKGATIPEKKNFENLSGAIDSIASGGGTDRLQWVCDNVKSLQYLCSEYQGTDFSILNGLDTSKVTNMKNMFYHCDNLTEVPNIDTSNVTNASYMFGYCGSLTEVPNIDTSNVTDASYMFTYCRGIKGSPKLNTSNLTEMASMFYQCSYIGDVTELDTRNVTGFSSLFYGCSINLKRVKLNTSNGKYFANMFNYCYALETVEEMDIQNASNSSSLGQTFSQCQNLTNLTLKNIKFAITIGSGNSYGHLLTVDSLVNTIKELWAYTSGSRALTMGSTNKNKLANVYVKLITPTAEQIEADPNIENKMPCEVCESTDEGAMLITDYATLKGWTIA